jgi:hypothetical protein
LLTSDGAMPSAHDMPLRSVLLDAVCEYSEIFVLAIIAVPYFEVIHQCLNMANR